MKAIAKIIGYVYMVVWLHDESYEEEVIDARPIGDEGATS